MRATVLLPALLLITLMLSLSSLVHFIASSAVGGVSLARRETSRKRIELNQSLQSLYRVESSLFSPNTAVMWAKSANSLLHTSKIFQNASSCNAHQGFLLRAPSAQPFSSAYTCRNPRLEVSTSLLDNIEVTTPLYIRNSAVIASAGMMHVGTLLVEDVDLALIALGSIEIDNIDSNGCLTLISLQGSVHVRAANSGVKISVQHKRGAELPASANLTVCEPALPLRKAVIFGLPLFHE